MYRFSLLRKNSRRAFDQAGITRQVTVTFAEWVNKLTFRALRTRQSAARREASPRVFFLSGAVLGALIELDDSGCIVGLL